MIAATLTDFPSIGVDPERSNSFHALAYCGHGVSTSNYVGSIIRDLFIRSLATIPPTIALSAASVPSSTLRTPIPAPTEDALSSAENVTPSHVTSVTSSRAARPPLLTKATLSSFTEHADATPPLPNELG
jgi:hypothetical protein